MIRQKDRKYIQDCKVIPGESPVKQHKLMVKTLNMTQKVKYRKTKMKERIRTWKLKGDKPTTFKHKIQL